MLTGWLLAITRDVELIRGLRSASMRDGRACQLWPVESIEQARNLLNERQRFPLLILLDEPFLEGASLAALTEEFSWCAPVVSVGNREGAFRIAPLVAAGRADFVYRDDSFLPLALALVERALGCEQEIDRRIAHADAAAAQAPECAWLPDPDGFPEEALRLLGSILENLEIVLSEPERIPVAARRLGRVADLAFDLKAGLRLLAGRAPSGTGT
jgi:hypothetical protein